MPAMRAATVTPAQRVASRADLQHGVVSRRQLRDAGLSDSAIGRQVEHGWLYRVHRGVYAVGHRRLPAEGRWMAAVLACGEGAALSHRSAAALWGMLPRSGPAVGVGGRIDVIVPYGAGGRRRAGLRIHRSRSLPPGSVVRRNGIPVTNSARTIADLGRSASATELRAMARKAEVLGLRTGLEPRREPTRSELEDIFLVFCEQHGFPKPQVNRKIAGHEVDFSWPELRVAVETDSYRFHRGAIAYENDHERELDLRRAGYDVVHLTWRQLTRKPRRCTAAVHSALRAAVNS